MSDFDKPRPRGARLNSTELSIETECASMGDSFNFAESLSPIPASMVPRKLDFSGDCEEEMRRNQAPLSPPYKRVRALRLFDSPATPKTILEKCSTPTHHGIRSRLFPPRLTAPSGKSSGAGHHALPPALTFSDDSAVGSLPPECDDSRPHNDSVASLGDKRANINPFTPSGQLMNKKKRALSKTPTSSPWDTTPEQPAKRLKESNISRYNVEFVELGALGSGEFGRVAKCLNRLDGCVYALKRSLRPVAGSAGERSALNEVYAHAVLGKHPHVVRYYSAWAEDDHMIIQNEYCDRGSLQELVARAPLPESELLVLLAHVADGLKYIHSMQLVHMDIKPGNVFVCGGGAEEAGGEGGDAGGEAGEGGAAHESADDGFEEHDDEEAPRPPATVYKIGDMGHVTCVSSPAVEEGDCRYLPREVLNEHLSDLTKADIFAFGLTLFEAGGGGPLPKNGEAWHAYRDGHLPDLPACSHQFNQLLKRMVHPDPAQRPTAARLLRHPLLQPAGNQSKAELRRQLAAARLHNQLLERKLQEAARCIKSLAPSAFHDSAKLRTRSAKRAQPPPAADNSRLIAEMIQSVTAPLRNIERPRKKL